MNALAAIVPPIKSVAIPPDMGRVLNSEVLNRETGELVMVSLGQWVTMRELSEIFETPRRRFTAILAEMEFVQLEGGSTNSRYRVTPEVVRRGFAKRVTSSVTGMPFDTVSPSGVRFICENWTAAETAISDKAKGGIVGEARGALEDFMHTRRSDLNTVQQVHWLADHYPHITAAEVGRVLDVSQQYAGRCLKKRDSQRTDWETVKVTAGKEDKGKVSALTKYGLVVDETLSITDCDPSGETVSGYKLMNEPTAGDPASPLCRGRSSSM